MKLTLSSSIILAALSCVAGKAVISNQVLQDASKSGLTPILIQLSQPEVPTLNTNSRMAVTENDLDNHAEQVVNTLVKHADDTKASVKSILDDAQKKGLIKGYRQYFISNTYAVEAPKELIEKLANIKEVEEIYSNKKVKSGINKIGHEEATQADDLVWDGKEPHWSLKYINATNLPKRIHNAASRLRVGVADSGVSYEHPVLINNYYGNKNGKINHDYAWWDANKVANETKPNKLCGVDSQKPCDDHSHGTHCTGTIVGAKNLGVSPSSKWMACKNMDQNFGSPETYLGCLQFFLAPTNLYGIKPNPRIRPHVVSNSYGCPGEEGCARSTFKYALRALKSSGIFMSVAAGNSGEDGCSSIVDPPAVDPNSFTVAASGYLTNNRAYFSSLGPVPERPNLAIDVTAPGANITSSVLNGKYARFSGTSMATPHIAGVALLVTAACPHLTRRVDLIAKVIRDSATPVYSKLGCGGDTEKTLPNNEFGYGIVNVAKAIELCKKTWF